MPALAARYRVITYDLPGFGESPLVGGGEISHVADLEAVLGAFGVERAALVGGSLGGRIALEFALERPGRDVARARGAGLRGHEWSSFIRQASDQEEEAFERGDYDAAADAISAPGSSGRAGGPWTTSTRGSGSSGRCRQGATSCTPRP